MGGWEGQPAAATLSCGRPPALPCPACGSAHVAQRLTSAPGTAERVLSWLWVLFMAAPEQDIKPCLPCIGRELYEDAEVCT